MITQFTLELISITILHHWKLCPGNKEPYNTDIYKIDRSLIDIQFKQDQFAEIKNIPSYSIVPEITKFIDMNSSDFNINVVQARNRFYIFAAGIVNWELTFQIEDQLVDKKLINSIRLNNRTIISEAIHRKKELCIDVKNNKLCDNCKLDRVLLSSIIIKFPSNNMSLKETMAHFDSSTKREVMNRIFEIGNLSIKTYKKFHVLYQLDPNRSLSKKVLNTLIWSTQIVTILTDFGKELIELSLQNIPPIRTKINNVQFDQTVTTFLKHFYTIYFWLNINFLLRKEGERLKIKSLPLKSLIYSYETTLKHNYWVIDSDLLKKIINLPILVYMKLIKIGDDLPKGIIIDMNKLFDPINYAIPPSLSYIESMSVLKQKICLEMGKHLWNSLKLNVRIPVGKQSHLGAISRNKIAKLIDFTSGSRANELQSVLDSLCDAEILINKTPKELEISRTSSNMLYYLNPNLPYTQAFVLLSQEIDDL